MIAGRRECREGELITRGTLRLVTMAKLSGKMLWWWPNNIVHSAKREAPDRSWAAANMVPVVAHLQPACPPAQGKTGPSVLRAQLFLIIKLTKQYTT